MGKPPLPPSRSLVVDAEEVRKRIMRLTRDDEIAPDPIKITKVESVTSGFLSLDDALVIDGFARGRVHAIEGPPDSGKTALCAAAVGAFQRAVPASVHAWLAVEPHAGDLKFLAHCGANVDPSRLILFRPSSAEEAGEVCMNLMGYVDKDGKWVRDPKVTPVSSITWDSWGGSPVDTRGMAPLARVGSDWWPLLSSRAERSKTTIWVTNHLSEKPGVSFGDPRYGKGGNTFKHHQCTRLWVLGKNYQKDPVTKRKVAHDIRVDVVRNKCGPANRSVELHLNYATGFDRVMDAYSFLKSRGVMFTDPEKANSTTYVYTFLDEEGNSEEIRVVGEAKFIDELRGYPEAQESFIATAQKLFAQGRDEEE